MRLRRVIKGLLIDNLNFKYRQQNIKNINLLECKLYYLFL